LIQNTMVN